VTIIVGDCREVMRELDEASVDAVVCDPPYEISFMAKSWDGKGVAFSVDTWREAFRVLKPGGHLLAFGGTRTFHRLTVAIEDAGFEIRDCLSWLYGSGFPKSLDVSKAIDKRRDDTSPALEVTRWLNAQAKRAGVRYAAILDHFGFNEGSGQIGHWTALSIGAQPAVPTWPQWLELKALLGFGDEMDAEVWRLNGRKGQPGEAWHDRKVIGERITGIGTGKGSVAYIGDSDNRDITAPATPEAEQWAGWGTALKPAWEPVIVARKPLVGTVAANVLAHGTGALNIDACRIDGAPPSVPQPSGKSATGQVYGFRNGHGRNGEMSHAEGRWPANVALDEAAAALLDEMSGESANGRPNRVVGSPTRESDITYGVGLGKQIGPTYMDRGGPSRYFLTVPLDDPDADLTRFAYVAKASRRERNAGLDGMPEWGRGSTIRGLDRQPYPVRVHDPNPQVIAAYLRDCRERAGLSKKQLDDALGTVTLYSWFEGRPAGIELPTPEMWLRLKQIIGFDDTHDREMTETRLQDPAEPTFSDSQPSANHHPTVKPIALMRWLVRLVTPPGGTVLDPFAGSASTGCACLLEGFKFVGIEQDAEYAAIAERRIAYWSVQARHERRKPIKFDVQLSKEQREANLESLSPSPRPTMLQPALPLEGVAD
jgi:DNA modification methylase